MGLAPDRDTPVPYHMLALLQHSACACLSVTLQVPYALVRCNSEQ